MEGVQVGPGTMFCGGNFAFLFTTCQCDVSLQRWYYTYRGQSWLLWKSTLTLVGLVKCFIFNRLLQYFVILLITLSERDPNSSSGPYWVTSNIIFQIIIQSLIEVTYFIFTLLSIFYYVIVDCKYIIKYMSIYTKLH